MKKAYKGFQRTYLTNKLRCRSTVFEDIDENIYYKSNSNDLITCKSKVYLIPIQDNSLKLCSSDGYHYCLKLVDVFNYYTFKDENVFCEINVLGQFNEDGVKGITNAFEITRIIPTEEVHKIYEEDKKIREEENFESNLNLNLVKQIQTTYPLTHVGGSVGLFLHGIRLKRYKSGTHDLDICAPYYFKPISVGTLQLEEVDVKASNNDFDLTFLASEGTPTEFRKSIKVDCVIDPRQRYEIINYKGFDYKVTPIELILEAKLKYSKFKSGKKHKKDIYEMLNIKK